MRRTLFLLSVFSFYQFKISARNVFPRIIDSKYIVKNDASKTDVLMPGIDVLNEDQLYNTLRTFIKYSKQHKRQIPAIEGYKFNLSKERARIKTEKINQEINSNLFEFLRSIMNQEKVQYIDFNEYKNECHQLFPILTMLAIKHDQIRDNMESVRLVLLPLGCHYLVDNIGKLNKHHLKILAQNFIEVAKKFDIKDPELECNFGIGNEQYIHWTLKSRVKNDQIEKFKQQYLNKTLNKVVPISDDLRKKMEEIFKQKDEAENKADAVQADGGNKKEKNKKKVAFKEEVEVVEIGSKEELTQTKEYKKEIGKEHHDRYISIAPDKNDNLLIKKEFVDYDENKPSPRRLLQKNTFRPVLQRPEVAKKNPKDEQNSWTLSGILNKIHDIAKIFINWIWLLFNWQ